MRKHSLYIHIPFCEKRCSYCDFNTYIDHTGIRVNYMHALREEIRKVGSSIPGLPVKSIYFGGGTPSLISLHEYSGVLDVLNKHFDLQGKVEISLEANPGTLSKTYLSGLVALGVNRMSLGMQASQMRFLSLLGREHTFEDVKIAVGWARTSGIANINLDLIYGVPGQSLADWKESLQSAVALAPEHLSLYSLTLENEVPMEHWIGEGKIPAQDYDLMAEMYEWAMIFLADNGYHHYEISNWAKQDEKKGLLSCEHNMQYWLNQPYLGFGAGAHGFASGQRTENVRGIHDYICRCTQKQGCIFPSGPALKQMKPVDRYLEMQETMMMGFRLVDIGISRDRFYERFEVEMESVFGKELQFLEGLQLIEYGGSSKQTVRLTRKGYLLGNQVFMQFVN